MEIALVTGEDGELIGDLVSRIQELASTALLKTRK